MMLRFVLLLVLLFTPSALAQESLPELTEDERTALSFPVEPGTALLDDQHFRTLIDHVAGWTRIPFWSAEPATAPELMLPERFATLGTMSFAEPGEAFVFGARFVRKEAVQGRPTLERWVVNPIDPSTDERAIAPVIVYVDRDVTGRTREPQSGWYVRIASRSYRTATVVSPRGNTLPTHSFVGAAFGVLPSPGGDISAYFPFFGIAISVIIAIGIVVAIVISVTVRDRKRKTGSEGA